MNLETFATRCTLRIEADFDPERLHKWHVKLVSPYGNQLRVGGSTPQGVAQSYTTAYRNLVRLLVKHRSLDEYSWPKLEYRKGYEIPRKLRAA